MTSSARPPAKVSIGRCCIWGWVSAVAGGSVSVCSGSDHLGEFIEGSLHPELGSGVIVGDDVVAVTDVANERVTRHHALGAVVTFQSAHRP